MEQSDDCSDGYGFGRPSNFMSQPPQIFGAYNADTSPAQPVLSGPIFGDNNEQGSVDENDPKRRRIARVSWTRSGQGSRRLLTAHIGMRHVSKEEGTECYILLVRVGRC
jgi:hypothetical protein